MPANSYIHRQKLARATDDLMEALQRLDFIKQHPILLTKDEESAILLAQEFAEKTAHYLIEALSLLDKRVNNK